MSVGIVVLNLNQKQLVEDFLQDLTNQTYKNFVVHLVDNGSAMDQQVATTPTTFKVIQHMLPSNTGFAAGNNVGIKAAINQGHEYIWIVNNDVRLDARCLELLAGYLSSHPDVGVVGPKIYYYDHKDTIWFAGGIINWSKPYPYTVNTHIGEGQKDTGQYPAATEVAYVTGASMFCQSDVLSTVGGFDERYFAYFEDADLSMRIKKQGYKLMYYPDAVMWHMVGMLSGVTSPRSSYYQIRNSLLFTSEWGPFSSRLLSLSNSVVIILKNILKLAIVSKRNFAYAQLKAVVDFYKGSFGGPVAV